MPDHCEIPRCPRPADLSYLGHGVCASHWNELTNENAAPDALRIALEIPAEHEPLTEDTMSKKKQLIEQPAETPKADVVTSTPEKKAKAPKATKAEKAAKPKREPNGENLVVFAFRLTPDERDAIHKAAGPGGASRFVRTIAVAAAAEDEAAIRGVIKEARELR